ncbi:MAG: hypothetical protein GY705_12435 [Bacteroidetes bacterium]|nr:hypothetical protein [Bacteroidota bacterium]
MNYALYFPKHDINPSTRGESLLAYPGLFNRRKVWHYRGDGIGTPDSNNNLKNDRKDY